MSNLDKVVNSFLLKRSYLNQGINDEKESAMVKLVVEVKVGYIPVRGFSSSKGHDIGIKLAYLSFKQKIYTAGT